MASACAGAVLEECFDQESLCESVLVCEALSLMLKLSEFMAFFENEVNAVEGEVIE